GPIRRQPPIRAGSLASRTGRIRKLGKSSISVAQSTMTRSRLKTERLGQSDRSPVINCAWLLPLAMLPPARSSHGEAPAIFSVKARYRILSYGGGPQAVEPGWFLVDVDEGAVGMDCWCGLGHVGTLRAVDSLAPAPGRRENGLRQVSRCQTPQRSG